MLERTNQIAIAKDLTVFRILLGTNRIINDYESITILKKAADMGINFIATTSSYTNCQSEKTIGNTFSLYKNIIIATREECPRQIII